MGGPGSGKRKGDGYSRKRDAKRNNLHTAMEEWFLKHPNEPYPMKRRRNGKVVIVPIWEAPKFGNEKKDGTKRRSWKRPEGSQALIATDAELKAAKAYADELEEIAQLRNSPEEKERVAEHRRRYQRQRYKETVQEQRKQLLPEDRCCILCDNKQITSKQWVICEFLDGKHAICKSCFSKLRIEIFGGDAKLLRAYLKTINYGKINLS